MGFKSGGYIVGGGHYNSHTLPPSVNPGALGVVRNTPQSVDDLLEPHEGLIRVAQGLERGAQILAPDPLGLCYIGILVIKDFPGAYQRYLDVLNGYKTAGVVDQKTIDRILNILERNRVEPVIGIGAMEIGNPVTAQLRLQPQLQR